MSIKKVYMVSVRDATQFADWYGRHGFTVTDDPFEADLFQFMGGEDVTPEIYGKENTDSHNSWRRDLYEMGYFALAQRLCKPMVGICRGGQFLNVMCGGEMIQDVKGHTRSHSIVTNEGLEIMATSTHHQMMVPSEHRRLLAWANVVFDRDPEVVYYPEEWCLCFQPHPEYGTYTGLEVYYFDLVHKLLKGVL